MISFCGWNGRYKSESESESEEMGYGGRAGKEKREIRTLLPLV